MQILIWGIMAWDFAFLAIPSDIDAVGHKLNLRIKSLKYRWEFSWTEEKDIFLWQEKRVQVGESKFIRWEVQEWQHAGYLAPERCGEALIYNVCWFLWGGKYLSRPSLGSQRVATGWLCRRCKLAPTYRCLPTPVRMGPDFMASLWSRPPGKARKKSVCASENERQTQRKRPVGRSGGRRRVGWTEEVLWLVQFAR